MEDIAAPVLTKSKLEGVEPRTVAMIKPHNGRGVSGAATFRNQAGHSGDTLSLFLRVEIGSFVSDILSRRLKLTPDIQHPAP
jgi:hypothetical protein